MEFYDFVNQQTYHFFTWVTKGGMVDVSDLVAKAMEQVEGNYGFQIGMDVSTTAKRELADLLEERLLELLDVGDLQDALGVVGTVDASLDSLTGPLLALSVNQIYFDVTAEAILRQRGKWSPDTERPEIKEMTKRERPPEEQTGDEGE